MPLVGVHDSDLNDVTGGLARGSKGDAAEAVLEEVTAVAAGDDGVLRGGFRYDNLAIALHWARHC